MDIKNLTSELDTIASDLQDKDPVIALAIDKISDHLERQASMTEYKTDDTPENRREADKLKPRILGYLKDNSKATMDKMYEDLKCDDISMYLAIHDLVKKKEIKGESPYESPKPSHKDYTYTL